MITLMIGQPGDSTGSIFFLGVHHSTIIHVRHVRSIFKSFEYIAIISAS